jgi:hypothetical protein
MRLWIRAGVVPRPARRGRATRYDARSVLRAQAGAALAKRMRRLRDVAAALDALDENGLRELAGLPPIEPPPPPPSLTPSTLPPPPLPPPPELAWESLPLVPGLELRIREDATPLTRLLAEKLLRGDWLR